MIAFDPDLMQQIEREIADESVGDDARDLSTDTAEHYGQLNKGNVFRRPSVMSATTSPTASPKTVHRI